MIAILPRSADMANLRMVGNSLAVRSNPVNRLKKLYDVKYRKNSIPSSV